MDRVSKLLALGLLVLLTAGCAAKNEKLARTHPWDDKSKTWTKICEPTADQVRCLLNNDRPCEIDDKVDHCKKMSESSLEEDITKLDEAEIKESGDRITVVFSDDVFFESASAKLSPSAKTTLNRLATLLDDHPDATVQVNGHTDARPISTDRFPDNLALSEARAQSVVDYLTTQRGLDSSRFTAKGYGAADPVTSDESQRQKNRRVEFVIEPAN